MAAFATSEWTYGPTRLERYNGDPSMEIQGSPTPGESTGTAMARMEALAKKLPPGIGYEWTGLSYEEKASGGAAGSLYALSLLIVFLCLAALYESWSVPIAVLLVVPLGVVGALLSAHLTHLDNDIYFQVGLITIIGVSAKNAILIVEFAEERMKMGMNAAKAALEAAKLRLRPILMTSFAFVFGVLPLAIAHGPGSGGQNAIGRGVIGGMLSATVLAIFFVPVFFIVVKRLFRQDAAPSLGPADRAFTHATTSASARPSAGPDRGGGLMSRRLAPFALTGLLLAGCVNLAPAYRRPAEPTPVAFPTGPAYAPPSASVQPVVGWRDFFADPKLKAVIEQALANNRDLRAAVANIAVARGQYQVQHANLYPPRRPGRRHGCSRSR